MKQTVFFFPVLFYQLVVRNPQQGCECEIRERELGANELGDMIEWAPVHITEFYLPSVLKSNPKYDVSIA